MQSEEPPTNWCPDRIRVRRKLDTNYIAYQWQNINKDSGVWSLVEKIYQGNQSIPTIIWMEGSFLADPSIKQLREKLGLSNRQMAILITRRVINKKFPCKWCLGYNKKTNRFF